MAVLSPTAPPETSASSGAARGRAIPADARAPTWTALPGRSPPRTRARGRLRRKRRSRRLRGSD
ncbi:hypothetical protein SCE1572_50670 [Sorangium cellulosum So0157-2]|uniref:Uncharacterized protein n=1 Tax=Sorangium cellulosum So0157-2 TaxID=1254432 RepID=S4Y982_SORCE|nr:hypothetical protein SCE1572_50670 [Sorangium cellulosum So0157-2]